MRAVGARPGPDVLAGALGRDGSAGLVAAHDWSRVPLVGLWHDVRMSTEPVIDSRPVWARLHRRSLLGAVVCAAIAVLLVMAVVTAFHEPDTGTDSRGMTISYGLITIVFLTAAAIAFATAAVARRALLRRCRGG